MNGRRGIASRTAMFGSCYKMRGQVPSYSPEHGLLQSNLQQACYISACILILQPARLPRGQTVA